MIVPLARDNKDGRMMEPRKNMVSLLLLHEAHVEIIEPSGSGGLELLPERFISSNSTLRSLAQSIVRYHEAI